MKISVKSREEQALLVRAKLPLNVLGVPLFTGVTSGDPRELALHLGTFFRAGPTVRLSYKPNNEYSPYSVLVKTGFGVGGSPNGAGFAMSAEFNLNSQGSPSFALRVKPKLGDFGVKKDTSCFTTSCEAAGAGYTSAVKGGEESKSVHTTGEAGRSREISQRIVKPHEDPVHVKSVSSVNGDVHGENAVTIENVARLSNGSLPKSGPISKGMSAEIADYSKDTSDSGSCDEEYRAVYDPRPSNFVAHAAGGDSGGGLSGWKSGLDKFRVASSATKGWSTFIHSSLPFGNRAVAKVRWQMKFSSNVFHDVRNGFRITDVKLPVLSIDKVSFEALDPFRGFGSKSRLEGGISDFGFAGDEIEKMSRIMAMCTYQLKLLHEENKILKGTIDEIRGDGSHRRQKGADLMMQEENVLRSQMFDELNGKVNGSNRSRRRSSKDLTSSGGSQELLSSGCGKGSSSLSADSSVNLDPSEELKKAIMNASSGG